MCGIQREAGYDYPVFDCKYRLFTKKISLFITNMYNYIHIQIFPVYDNDVAK